jgi:hypothetical protein
MDEAARHAELVPLFLTTEHYNLSTARSGTIADSNGRASLFLGVLSSSVVALALVAQVSRVGKVFLIFASVLLPLVFFLGFMSFWRIVQSSVEYMIYTGSIQRIRRYYLDAAPEIAPYFVVPPPEDIQGGLRALGIARSGSRQTFFTLAGLIGVIDAAVLGVYLGLILLPAMGVSPLAAGLAGAAVFVLAAGAFLRRAHVQFAEAAATYMVPAPRSTEGISETPS